MKATAIPAAQDAHPQIAPAPLTVALPLFVVPSAVFCLALYVGIPLMMRAGLPLSAIFTIALPVPLALMLLASLVALPREGWPFTWNSVKIRFSSRPDESGRMVLGWFTRSLHVWGKSGSFAVVALWLERRRFTNLLLGIAGVAGFILASWAIGFTAPWLSRLKFYEEPAFLKDFLSHLGPNDFMGFPLHGRWWIVIYYVVVLKLLNIAGEELWWRGYILPRQEPVHGRATWAIHGFLWAAFHIFWIWNFWDLVAKLPTCMALAFVCQKQKNTWPGVIGHTFGNSAILVGIVRGVIG